MGREQTYFFFLFFFCGKRNFGHNFRRVSEKSMWDWALTLAEAVCQRSVRQETTMARVGTLPSYLYHKEVLPWDSVSLKPAKPSASKANERDEAGDEDDEEGVLEYDFSDSVEDSEERSLGINDNDEADDDVGDIPFLDCEANFLLRTVFRFGRTITFNNRIISYASARIYLKF